MKVFIWFLVIVLIVLHQDYWQWENGTLVFGFLPYSLAYHVGISLAASVVWILATKFCWPAGLTEIASEAEIESAAPALSDSQKKLSSTLRASRRDDREQPRNSFLGNADQARVSLCVSSSPVGTVERDGTFENCARSTENVAPPAA